MTKDHELKLIALYLIPINNPNKSYKFNRAKTILKTALQLYNLAIYNRIDEYQDYSSFGKFKCKIYEIAFKHLYNTNGIKACSNLCDQLTEPNLILLHSSMLGHRYFDIGVIKKMEAAYEHVVDMFEFYITNEPSKLNTFSKKGPNKWYISTLFYWARHVSDIDKKRKCLIRLVKFAQINQLSPDAVSMKYIRALEWLICFANVPDIIELGYNKLMAYPKYMIINKRILELNTDPKILKNKFTGIVRPIKKIGKTKSINLIGNP